MLKLNHLTGFGSGAAAGAAGDVTSRAFNGVNSYLSIPDHADWDFMTSDFTIEFFYRVPDGTPALDYSFYEQYVDNSNYARINLDQVGAFDFISYQSASIVFNAYGTGATTTANTWHHFAACRDGDNYYLYVDGTDVTFSGSPDSDNPVGMAAPLFIGVKGNFAGDLQGYVDEYRISDTCRYPGGTGFTPTTTQFVSDANTLLLIHGGEAYTGPLTGETTQSCVTFDGTGDYLTIPDSADWEISTSSEYTIEFWVRHNSAPGDEVYFNHYQDGSNWGFYLRYSGSSGGVQFFVYLAGVTHASMTTSDLINDTDWHHIAVTKTSGDLYTIWVDGVDSANATDSDSGTTSGTLNIGQRGDGTRRINGSMAEIRLSDTDRYPSDFSASLPTERFTSDANTKLLIHGDENGGGTAAFTDSGNTGHTVTPTGNAFLGNGGTFTDSGNTGHTVSENGQAQKETEQEFKLADDGVGYFFDGTGDYLSIPDHADWNLTGDHTIECFIRLPDVSAHDDMIYAQVLDGNNRRHLSITSDGTINYYCKESSTFLFQVYTGAGEISDNTWYHVAVVRDGDDYYTYVDGVSKSVSGSPDSSNPSGIAAPLRIGTYAAATEWLGGYIDELRVSDTCRYPDGTTFAPTTTQFVSDANTLLLIHGGEAKSGTTGSGATFTDSGDTGHTVTENGNAIESTGNFYKF
jgi:hypothetical protein